MASDITYDIRRASFVIRSVKFALKIGLKTANLPKFGRDIIITNKKREGVCVCECMCARAQSHTHIHTHTYTRGAACGRSIKEKRGRGKTSRMLHHCRLKH